MFHIKKLATATALTLSPTLAFATTLEVIGDGHASHAAEFLKINIELASECHGSAVGSKQSLDELLAKVRTVVTEKIDPSVPDSLVVLHGVSDQSVKQDYVEGRLVKICDENHAWRSTSRLVIKLTAIDELAELQDAVLRSVPGSPVTINTPRSTLSLGKPTPGVFSDTYSTLVDTATENAHNHALHQVEVLTRRTPGAEIKLVRVAPSTQDSGNIVYDRTLSSADPEGSSLGRVYVQVSRKFIFNVK